MYTLVTQDDNYNDKVSEDINDIYAYFCTQNTISQTMEKWCDDENSKLFRMYTSLFSRTQLK